MRYSFLSIDSIGRRAGLRAGGPGGWAGRQVRTRGLRRVTSGIVSDEEQSINNNTAGTSRGGGRLCGGWTGVRQRTRGLFRVFSYAYLHLHGVEIFSSRGPSPCANVVVHESATASLYAPCFIDLFDVSLARFPTVRSKTAARTHGATADLFVRWANDNTRDGR